MKHYLVSEDTLRQVLDALTSQGALDNWAKQSDSIEALRAIMSKGPVEPVAWKGLTGILNECGQGTPLYAIPKEEGTFRTTSIPSPQYMKWEPKEEE